MHAFLGFSLHVHYLWSCGYCGYSQYWATTIVAERNNIEDDCCNTGIRYTAYVLGIYYQSSLLFISVCFLWVDS